MIVWGGSDGTNLNTGGLFDPAVGGPSGSWTSTNTTGAPSARYVHTAVWTGLRMVIWGGFAGGYANTGGQWFVLSYFIKN